eukprot:m.173275 g.173275  ORF g.173275 m.173275 type:complete len:406 (-) comp15303_c0_seq2:337-1554(-)
MPSGRSKTCSPNVPRMLPVCRSSRATRPALLSVTKTIDPTTAATHGPSKPFVCVHAKRPVRSTLLRSKLTSSSDSAFSSSGNTAEAYALSGSGSGDREPSSQTCCASPSQSPTRTDPSPTHVTMIGSTKGGSSLPMVRGAGREERSGTVSQPRARLWRGSSVGGPPKRDHRSCHRFLFNGPELRLCTNGNALDLWEHLQVGQCTRCGQLSVHCVAVWTTNIELDDSLVDGCAQLAQDRGLLTHSFPLHRKSPGESIKGLARRGGRFSDGFDLGVVLVAAPSGNQSHTSETGRPRVLGAKQARFFPMDRAENRALVKWHALVASSPANMGSRVTLETKSDPAERAEHRCWPRIVPTILTFLNFGGLVRSRVSSRTGASAGRGGWWSRSHVNRENQSRKLVFSCDVV